MYESVSMTMPVVADMGGIWTIVNGCDRCEHG